MKVTPPCKVSQETITFEASELEAILQPPPLELKPYPPCCITLKGQEMVIREAREEEIPLLLQYMRKIIESPQFQEGKDYYDIVTARVYAELLGVYRKRLKDPYTFVGVIDGELAAFCNGRLFSEEINISLHTMALKRGLRAGAIADSMDRAMVQELLINCELAEIGREMGCQTMVEGPGHVPLDEIEANIILEKRMSGGAPYYMLGPLPADVGAGWDHITAAIGAAQSSRYGADLICYITPAEHLGLPNVEDVITGVKAARLAAHIGDLSKMKEKTFAWDKKMSVKRRDMDWEAQFDLAMFPDDAKNIYRDRSSNFDTLNCTMCGEYCANKGADLLFQDVLEKSIKKGDAF